MAIHSRKGSLAAHPMIRSDVQHCPIRFSTGSSSPHLLTEDSRSGLIVSHYNHRESDDSLGPIQCGTCPAYLGNRRDIDHERDQKVWLTKALNAEISANRLVHRPRQISLLLHRNNHHQKGALCFSKHFWVSLLIGNASFSDMFESFNKPM